MKVLLSCHVGFLWEELLPMSDHPRLIKGHLEFGSDHTLCAPMYRAAQPGRHPLPEAGLAVLKEREGCSYPSPPLQVAPGGWSVGSCGVGTGSWLCPVPRRA